jgi:predicted metalloprotease
VNPDAFTHGTSQQRVRWFKVGFEKGEIAACDTFAVQGL